MPKKNLFNKIRKEAKAWKSFRIFLYCGWNLEQRQLLKYIIVSNTIPESKLRKFTEQKYVGMIVWLEASAHIKILY